MEDIMSLILFSATLMNNSTEILEYDVDTQSIVIGHFTRQNHCIFCANSSYKRQHIDDITDKITFSHNGQL